MDNCVHYLHFIQQKTQLNKDDDTHCNVWRSEEKLSVEVWLLYSVHVCHNDLAFSTSQSNHGKVFQQLTANGTCSNLEWLKVTQWVKLSKLCSMFHVKTFNKHHPFTLLCGKIQVFYYGTQCQRNATFKSKAGNILFFSIVNRSKPISSY